MRYGRIAALAAAVGVATAALAMSPMSTLSGHYYRLPPVRVKQRQVWRLVWPRVNDVADIAAIDALHAFVRLDIKLGGQSCHFAGIARIEREELVYRDVRSGGDQPTACTLTFTREGGNLAWTDNGHCSAVCSSGLTGTLPASHRGAAPSIARLSRTADYSSASAAWQAAGGR